MGLYCFQCRSNLLSLGLFDGEFFCHVCRQSDSSNTDNLFEKTKQTMKIGSKFISQLDQKRKNKRKKKSSLQKIYWLIWVISSQNVIKKHYRLC